MDTRGIRETVGGSSKLLLLVLTHVIVAPLVTFVSSHIVFLPGVFLIVLLGQHAGRALCFTLIGFCGVFIGSRVLPPLSRLVGALGLVLFQLIYYSHFVAIWDHAMEYEGRTIDMYHRSLMELIFLAIGGLLATTVILWFSSKSLRQFVNNRFASMTECAPPGWRD